MTSTDHACHTIGNIPDLVKAGTDMGIVHPVVDCCDRPATVGLENVGDIPLDCCDRPATVGLENVGDTCWLNSVVQSLFHCPSFRSRVHDLCASSHCSGTALEALDATF
eukprot:2766875-Rhodomonas_salina.2